MDRPGGGGGNVSPPHPHKSVWGWGGGGCSVTCNGGLRPQGGVPVVRPCAACGSVLIFRGGVKYKVTRESNQSTVSSDSFDTSLIVIAPFLERGPGYFSPGAKVFEENVY